MVLSISQFIAHLHPVLVHLPIGILLLACLFLWQARKDRFEHLEAAINPMLFWGMISAILSCITGYMLSINGDYDQQQIGLHKWMGIAVTAISVITYLARISQTLKQYQWIPATLLLLLLFITGHLGGSLTHGSDYLTGPLFANTGSDSTETAKPKSIPNVQLAFVYADIVQPILQNKCYHCHGPERQKGRLRMDDSIGLMKGGKDGPVIIPFHSSQSELIKRIHLPPEDDHHMAPRDRAQLTENEISVLNWWIENGAPFSLQCRDVKQDGRIKEILTAFQTQASSGSVNPTIPLPDVEQASGTAIEKLKEKGIVVMPVSRTSHYLQADFVSAPQAGDNTMPLLSGIQKQLIWLNLSHTSLTDEGMKQLQYLPQLMRLDLSNTKITDRGMVYLDSLYGLTYLNLVGDSVTEKGLNGLTNLKKLKSVYLYHSAVNKTDWAAFQKKFPLIHLDSGGYEIPFLDSDTAIVKAPVSK